MDEEIFRLLKEQAVKQGKTMSEILEEALRQVLLPRKKQAPAFKLRWRTVPGGLVPGVDIADRDSLYERMESRG